MSRIPGKWKNNYKNPEAGIFLCVFDEEQKGVPGAESEQWRKLVGSRSER